MWKFAKSLEVEIYMQNTHVLIHTYTEVVQKLPKLSFPFCFREI